MLLVLAVKWVVRFVLVTLLYAIRMIFSHPFKFVEDVMKIHGRKEEIIYTSPETMAKLQANSNYNPELCSEEVSSMRYNIKDSKMAFCTQLGVDGVPRIYICLELALEEVEKANKGYGGRIFHGASLAIAIFHELWHCTQYHYLVEKGTTVLANEVTAREPYYLYGDSPLEKGANKYGKTLGLIKQNLDDLVNRSNTEKIINGIMSKAG